LQNKRKIMLEKSKLSDYLEESSSHQFL